MLGVFALALAAWQVRESLLLAFAAVVVGVVFDAAAVPICRHTRLRRRYALIAAVLLVIGMVALLAVLVGAQVKNQLGEFGQRLPDVVRYLETQLGISLPALNGSGGSLQDQQGGAVADLSKTLMGQITTLGTMVFASVTNLVLVIVGGVFLAVDPRIYKAGLVKLFPPERHERIEDALDTCGRALKLWLLAQVIAMGVVGTLAGLGTWFLGLPAPVALGIFAGLAEFIPVVGPIAGAVPAVLLALTIDMSTALWTLGLFVVIQQLESNVITPIVQLRLVSIPPALLLFAVIAFGTLFGPIGILVAAPMTVVAFVLVQKLYVRETLGEPVKIPGEQKAGG
ncbi:AI-2E family transporter [Prosthecomicrobium sp. N25]|uniref:AI-2E family transporter n=1 Tax=Prosthecomicrobium sp. N25 TaxID=3129254 RepID=UPI003077EA72